MFRYKIHLYDTDMFIEKAFMSLEKAKEVGQKLGIGYSIYKGKARVYSRYL